MNFNIMNLFYFFQFIMVFSGFKIILSDTECPIVESPNQDRRLDKSSLRIVQYNVEWLFIDYYAGMDCPGDGCTWKNDSQAKKHLKYVSKVIDKLNPDIINFCEIEGCDELNMLKNTLITSNFYANYYNTYLKKGTDTGTGQNVGILTKLDPSINLYRTEIKTNYPLIGSKCGYSGTGSTGVSKHFITEFKFNGMDVAFVSAHLLAIPTDPARCAQREGQAYVLQKSIKQYIDSGYEVILLGDFNDYDGDVPDINNNMPISRVLKILKGFDPFSNTNVYELNSVAETIVQKERYSDWWDSDNDCSTNSQRDFSMIDHILVTKAIQNNIENAFIYHGYDEYCGKMNSDHYPLVIDLFVQ
jgi:exonuclease III